MIDEYLPIIAQTGILLVAFVASARISERRISQIETKVEHLEEAVKPIPGISRGLARMEGQCKSNHPD